MADNVSTTNTIGRVRIVIAAALVLLVSGVGAQAASGPDAVYTVGNYPVEATAADAVTAKDKALQDGQQAAFKSLLKRIVPVRAYDRIAKMPPVKAAELIDGVGVRSERNSSTQYIASLDFTFRAGAVRDILRAQGIPFVDTQSAPVTLLPVALGDSPAAQQRLQKIWTGAWQLIDAPHALVPLKFDQPRGEFTADKLRPLADGDGALIDRLATAYKSSRILVAFAEQAGGQLQVTLAGQDAVGSFLLRRAYKIAGGDVEYAAELAAVIASGVLDGRWKVQRVQSAGGLDVMAQAPVPVQVVVQYATLQQWQDMRRRLAELPGVEDVQFGGVTARSADVALRFPGGSEALAEALQAQGYDVRPSGVGLVVRAGG